MNMKRTVIAIIAVASLVGIILLSLSCNNSGGARATDTIGPGAACGQVKGSGLCCKQGQAKYQGCGLAKSTPGCCKTDVKSAELCVKCGHTAGSALCCKAGQPRCSKCGLVKDSYGCCKITQQ